MKQLSTRLADSVDAKLNRADAVGTPMEMASVACAADLFTSEDIVDTSEGGRKALYSRLSPGRAIAFRMFLAA